MPDLSPQSLMQLATSCLSDSSPAAVSPPRLMSIWEMTTWVLPMAPEHLRRVLAADPALPQGSAGSEGGTRWFTLDQVAILRAHFIARSRKPRYAPARALRAALITLTGPGGGMGRTTALIHLATAASLAGYRVLVIEGDPNGNIARTLNLQGPAPSGDVVSLIARSAAQHLRRVNEARLDRGEAPQPMDAQLTASLGEGGLTLATAALIRPTKWPRLDLLPATAALGQADLGITSWRLAQRSWHPWRALADALDSDGIRSRYDLIFCDTPRGLGPLALALLTSADMLLAPLPLQSQGLAHLGAGLASLATATQSLEVDMQTTARALGQSAASFGWQRLVILPTRAGPDAARHLANATLPLGPRLLPAALPDLPAGTLQFYDMDYRDLGRLPYAVLRDACDAAWAGLAPSLNAA